MAGQEIIMTRSAKKGPYVDERVLKKVLGKKPEETGAFVSKSSVMRVVNRERLERSLTSKLIEQGRY
jgi:hypothetical protein